jgi:hypothetical protein
MMLQPGQCRHCHCTESNACRLPDGDTCAWIDSTRLVCSSPACIKAEIVRRDAAIAASRPKRLTSADIHRIIAGRKGSKKSIAAQRR